ncbi:hypothetical protein E8E11_010278 [Didymella keratinophila]|nr:hypothetical protein E8E11_010278 [Didymella keratinophila]
MISSGFTNAPVSQFLVFGTVIGSLVASLTDTRYYLPIAVVPHIWGYGQLWRVLTWSWVWTNSTEVLFGVLGFYQLRVVERCWGSRKFLSFILATLPYTTLLPPLLLTFVLRPLSLGYVNYLPSGPTSLLFALLANYYAAIPYTYKYRIAPSSPSSSSTTTQQATSIWSRSLTITSKATSYLAPAQLALSQFPGSVIAAALGWAVGTAYRRDLLPGVYGWRVPGWMVGEEEGEKGGFDSLRQRLESEREGSRIKGRRVYALDAMHSDYSDVVRVGPNEVSVANWRHIRTIYINTKTVVKDPTFYASATFVGKNNMFQMINPIEHAARRKLSSPPYAAQSVSKLDPLVQKKAEDLAYRLITEASASPTNTADAHKLCGLFSFETICKAGFAKDFDGSDGAEASLELLRAMDGSAPTLIFDGVLPFLRPTGLGAKLPGFIGDAYRNHQYWQQQSRIMVDHFLEKSSADEKYLLSPMATGIDTLLGRRLNHEELVEEAMGYMFAGSGTTSSTLTYFSRRVPPPKDTVVGMQNWIHHRNPAVFPNSDSFQPERWLQSTEAMEASLTPSNIGRRNYIGQNLAWQELCLAVSTILRAGLKPRIGPEMEDWEMEIEDLFNIAPRGHRLMLKVTRG